MRSETNSQIEALLFAAGQPVQIEKISKQLKLSAKTCKEEIKKLGSWYEESGSGLQLISKDSKVQLVSNSKHGQIVAKFLSRDLEEPLSKAAVEVLSVIAYRGPLTRAQIEHIRGVNCSFTLRNLAIRGLVERQDNPADSRSFIYDVSLDFVRSMGIKEVTQLPDYQQLHEVKIATEENLEDQNGKNKEDIEAE